MSCKIYVKFRIPGVLDYPGLEKVIINCCAYGVNPPHFAATGAPPMSNARITGSENSTVHVLAYAL